MVLLLLLGLGAAALLGGSAKAPAQKPIDVRAALDKYVSNCEVDPNLTSEQVFAVRAKMSSAVQGFTTPMDLFAYGEQLERDGYPKSGYCCKILANQLLMLQQPSA
jgi:hypothetical protein